MVGRIVSEHLLAFLTQIHSDPVDAQPAVRTCSVTVQDDLCLACPHNGLHLTDPARPYYRLRRRASRQRIRNMLPDRHFAELTRAPNEAVLRPVSIRFCREHLPDGSPRGLAGSRHRGLLFQLCCRAALQKFRLRRQDDHVFHVGF